MKLPLNFVAESPQSIVTNRKLKDSINRQRKERDDRKGEETGDTGEGHRMIAENMKKMIKDVKDLSKKHFIRVESLFQFK